MIQKGRYIVVIIFVCLAALVSCASHRTDVARISDDELKRNLYYENIILKRYAISDSIQNIPDVSLAIDECEIATINALERRNAFKIIKKDDGTIQSGKNLLVESTLTDIRIVSGAARFWAGAMAGRSHMKIYVKLIDATSGTIVAEKELVGVPSGLGAAYSMGASDRNLPKLMGILVADYIASNAIKK
jgi:hypothetical protein